jgi:hypothetical protein
MMLPHVTIGFYETTYVRWLTRDDSALMQNLVDKGVNIPIGVDVNCLQHEGYPLHFVFREHATNVTSIVM